MGKIVTIVIVLAIGMFLSVKFPDGSFPASVGCIIIVMGFIAFLTLCCSGESACAGTTTK
jgi:hypothetical protein